MVKGILNENRFQEAASGAESAMKIGTVLAGVLGAGAAWVLGGQSVLLAAAGGLATALALPHVGTAISQFLPSFRQPNVPLGFAGGNAVADSPEAEPERHATSGGVERDAFAVSETYPGGLPPISGILPGSKTHSTKSRP